MNLKRILTILLLGASVAVLPQQAHAMSYAQPLYVGASNIINNYPSFIIGGTLGLLAYKNINARYRNSLYWNWNIDASKYNDKSVASIFKQRKDQLAKQGIEWLWGVGTSAHQVEGDCTNNNWFEWSQLSSKEAKKYPNRKANMIDAGKACDHWNRYKEDIQLLKKLGVNSYRFSIEWSKVMPAPGVINYEAIAHYINVCTELVANNIKPVITLYHYTEPLWFYHQKREVLVDDTHFPHLKKLVKPGEKTVTLTGWEDPENIRYFVTFCQEVFDALHPYVHLWLTFNSAEGQAAGGWLTEGKRPPGKKSMPLYAEVLKNLLEAHVQVYRALKARPGGAAAKIGLLKNMLQLDKWDICNPLDHLACKIATNLQNECVFTFLKTGKFSLKVPFSYAPLMVNIEHTNEYLANGGKCLDFIGLNYYCHKYMKNFKDTRVEWSEGKDPKQEIATDNPDYTIYAEGFYRAIKELSDQLAYPLDVPIYVTENGIGTKSDDDRRIFSERYLYALAKALEEGYKVNGYILWSFMDNYEWGSYDIRYGLYHVDFATQQRSLKPGADYYINMIAASA